MLNAPASGCGPGISRPADTPQEGVRIVRVRRDETSALLELGRIVGDIDALLWADVVDWPEVARTFQKGADVAGVLSNHYRAGDRAVAGQRGVLAGQSE